MWWHGPDHADLTSSLPKLSMSMYDAVEVLEREYTSHPSHGLHRQYATSELPLWCPIPSRYDRRTFDLRSPLKVKSCCKSWNLLAGFLS